MVALARLVDVVDTTYLGYPIRITERTVTVRTPSGRLIGQARSLSGARRLVRGYRRDLNKQSPPHLTLPASATGPDRKEA